MAVQRPPAGIVSASKAPFDGDDLERMSVQKHRMRHHRVVDEEELDALARRDRQRRRLLRVGDAIERPLVTRYT
jgi:hypothetical protein